MAIKALTLALLQIVFFLFLASDFAAKFTEKNQEPLDFYIRDRFGTVPELDPRLKVFAVDDSTVSALQRANLDLVEWETVFERLAALNPKAIVVDKIFGIPDLPRVQQKDIEKAIQRLASKKRPIIGGAFLPTSKLQFREEIPFGSSHLATFATGKSDPSFVSQQRFAYGPFAALLPAFQNIGHIHYDGTGRIEPFVRVGPQIGLPHIALWLANDRQWVEGGQLKLDGKVLPQGKTLVNLAHPSVYKSRIFSFRSLLEPGNLAINPGDIVFLLPLYYTGNTDFKDSPYGQIPASLIHLAVANSVLQKSWITEWEPRWLYAMVVVTSAWALLLLPHVWQLICFTSGILIISTLAAQFLFSQAQIHTYWLAGNIAFLFCAVAMIYLRLRLLANKSLQIRSALDGAIAKSRMREISLDPDKVSFEAKEQVVTVMFVDVVGYSLLAENQMPRIAFEQLKILLNSITEEVHLFEGIVNKTLGDGLLCLFGFRFDMEDSMADHAEKAIRSAIRIQEKNIERNLKASASGDPVYPLRIGIHTSSVFLGDIGVGARIDFTAVGNGVNFAKRLEQSCEPHSIVFSATTKDLVSGLMFPHLQKKMISIKHHASLFESYEYDPFHQQPHLRKEALEAYRRCASLARVDQRISIERPDRFRVYSVSGIGRLLNYSPTGVSMKIRDRLEKGSTLALRIDSADGSLGSVLKKVGLESMLFEVRWVYTESDGCVHGMMISGLTEAQGRLFVEAIHTIDQASLHEVA